MPLHYDGEPVSPTEAMLIRAILLVSVVTSEDKVIDEETLKTVDELYDYFREYPYGKDEDEED